MIHEKATIPTLRKEYLYTVGELLAVFLMLLFTCVTVRSDSARTVNSEVMADALASCGLGEMEEGTGQTMKRIFSKDPQGCEWYILYTSKALMDVDELLVVYCPDQTEMAEYQDAVAQRLDAQTTSFTGYGTDQIDLLEHAVVRKQGDYLFYGVSEQAAQWEQAFLSCIR